MSRRSGSSREITSMKPLPRTNQLVRPAIVLMVGVRLSDRQLARVIRRWWLKKIVVIISPQAGSRMSSNGMALVPKTSQKPHITTSQTRNTSTISRIRRRQVPQNPTEDPAAQIPISSCRQRRSKPISEAKTTAKTQQTSHGPTNPLNKLNYMQKLSRSQTNQNSELPKTRGDWPRPSSRAGK